MIKVVFFDLGDTLCDYQAAAEAAIDTACDYAVSHAESLNATGLHEAYVREAGHMAEETRRWTASRFATGSGLDEQGYRLWERALEKCGVANPILSHAVALHYQLSRMRTLQLFPDARPALQALHGRARVGLVAEGSSGIVNEELALLGIRELFSLTVIEGEAGYAKGDPQLLAFALREAECEPAEAAYVGDSLERDVAPAREAGLVTVWVNRNGEEAVGADLPPPDHVVDSLEPVPDLLLSQT
ncbi:MAG: HAD family hydrolase [Armatimonadota bacterium]|nr:MAG: HAD family hydrolase [Armatimonadota bacterium]